MSVAYATFGGGCFWCLERPFTIYGVSHVCVGYMGGDSTQATYGHVSRGNTGHYEVVHLQYDPQKIPYDLLLNIFMRHHDLDDAGGQFLDRGSQYAPVIFYHTPEQETAAKRILTAWGAQTALRPAQPFYPAEPEHQQYYLTCHTAYKQYAMGSGRHAFLESHQRAWLSEDQLAIINGGTEPPFKNAYWDNIRTGLYCDALSHEPLFHSDDKYDSGTGWPSFTASLVPLLKEPDYALGYKRVEVRAPQSGAHLGHVFDDGPNGHPRYCINSAALVFY